MRLKPVIPAASMRAGLIAIAVVAGGCRQDMHDAPRYEPLEASTFFADGRSSRPLLANTVARGQLRQDRHLYEGVVNGQPAETLPMPVTAALMARGQERFNVFCSPCHGRSGEGDGMIVQRGFPRPPSFHLDRLKNAPHGHLYNVISNGYGAMYSYGDRIEQNDRWRIVAYVRALQLSEPTTPTTRPGVRQ